MNLTLNSSGSFASQAGDSVVLNVVMTQVGAVATQYTSSNVYLIPTFDQLATSNQLTCTFYAPTVSAVQAAAINALYITGMYSIKVVAVWNTLVTAEYNPDSSHITHQNNIFYVVMDTTSGFTMPSNTRTAATFNTNQDEISLYLKI
jgi:hypothetical protein